MLSSDDDDSQHSIDNSDTSSSSSSSSSSSEPSPVRRPRAAQKRAVVIVDDDDFDSDNSGREGGKPAPPRRSSVGVSVSKARKGRVASSDDDDDDDDDSSSADVEGGSGSDESFAPAKKKKGKVAARTPKAASGAAPAKTSSVPVAPKATVNKAGNASDPMKKQAPSSRPRARQPVENEFDVDVAPADTNEEAVAATAEGAPSAHAPRGSVKVRWPATCEAYREPLPARVPVLVCGRLSYSLRSCDHLPYASHSQLQSSMPLLLPKGGIRSGARSGRVTALLQMEEPDFDLSGTF